MPGRNKIDTLTTVLIVAWALLGGYELHTWIASDPFPPGPVMSLMHVGLATLTVIAAIAKRERSAKANYELGREVERVTGTNRSGAPTLRAVEEASSR